MKIAVTGVNGFVGKNLLVHLKFMGYDDIVQIQKTDNRLAIVEKLRGAEIVFHLAGVNRPEQPEEFEKSNVELTKFLITTMEGFEKPYRFIFSSSSQAELVNPYGISKRKAE